MEGKWVEHGEKRFAGLSRAKLVESQQTWVRYNMSSGGTEGFPEGVMMLAVPCSILTVTRIRLRERREILAGEP